MKKAHLFLIFVFFLITSCSQRSNALQKEHFESFTVISKNSVTTNTVISCIVENKTVLVPVEQFAKLSTISCTVCGRCGNTTIADRLLIEWNTPYVQYQDEHKKQKLHAMNRFENNMTYADIS